MKKNPINPALAHDARVYPTTWRRHDDPMHERFLPAVRVRCVDGRRAWFPCPSGYLLHTGDTPLELCNEFPFPTGGDHPLLSWEDLKGLHCEEELLDLPADWTSLADGSDRLVDRSDEFARSNPFTEAPSPFAARHVIRVSDLDGELRAVLVRVGVAIVIDRLEARKRYWLCITFLGLEGVCCFVRTEDGRYEAHPSVSANLPAPIEHIMDLGAEPAPPAPTSTDAP